MSTAAVKDVVIVLLALTCLAYLPVSQAKFAYEDTVYVSPAQYPVSLKTIMTPRGLTALSFRYGAMLRGWNPTVYHAQNVLLHLLTGLVVLALAWRFLTPPFALLAAGLFLLHPLNTEAVAYVAGRAEIIAGFGVAATVWAFSAPTVTWTHVGLGALGLVVAVGGKEVGAMALPLVALIYVIRRGLRVTLKGAIAAVGFLMALGLVFWFIIQFRMVGNNYFLTAERGGFGYLAYQSSALWYLLGQVAWPNGLTIDHDFEVWSRPQMVIALVGGVGTVASLWLMRHRWPIVTLGGLWVVVALGPRFLIRIPEYLNEHQMYVPMIGIVLAVAAALESLDGWLRRPKETVCVSEVSSLLPSGS